MAQNPISRIRWWIAGIQLREAASRAVSAPSTSKRPVLPGCGETQHAARVIDYELTHGRNPTICRDLYPDLYCTASSDCGVAIICTWTC